MSRQSSGRSRRENPVLTSGQRPRPRSGVIRQGGWKLPGGSVKFVLATICPFRLSGFVAMASPAFPKLHNAMWPGLVGKEPGTDHPPISLDRMLELTANAEVNGQKFEGVDLFLFHPHTDPDAS